METFQTFFPSVHRVLKIQKKKELHTKAGLLVKLKTFSPLSYQGILLQKAQIYFAKALLFFMYKNLAFEEASKKEKKVLFHHQNSIKNKHSEAKFERLLFQIKDNQTNQVHYHKKAVTARKKRAHL